MAVNNALYEHGKKVLGELLTERGYESSRVEQLVNEADVKNDTPTQIRLEIGILSYNGFDLSKNSGSEQYGHAIKGISEVDNGSPAELLIKKGTVGRLSSVVNLIVPSIGWYVSSTNE